MQHLNFYHSGTCFASDVLDNTVCIENLKPAIYIAKLINADGKAVNVKLVKN